MEKKGFYKRIAQYRCEQQSISDSSFERQLEAEYKSNDVIIACIWEMHVFNLQ